ncbi:anaerobic ribonucleoside-triphosphate reductase activating protein [Uliginosibacterium flavum]|uniref:Anaerobic ribonucleoside-triphosphate reductase activating protein n=1 Tax=Uliginosibacterium flavum TaxID=1396831 RepID=A0ABV2TGT2_9RHOO
MSAHAESALAEVPWTERILLGSFTPASDHDWPGRRAATIYLLGCPWRCAYCHNPQLQKRGTAPALSWSRIAAKLTASRDTISGVVFSGGEPTTDRTLPEAIAAVKALGLPVGLHTSGAYPERLETLLPQLDWVGFDLKTDYESYDKLTGAPGSAARATQSARLIIASGVAHEFRLTWHHQVINEESALLAAHFAQHLGARRFVLQAFRSEGVANPTLAPESMPSAELVAQLRALFADFEVRGDICGLAD